MVDVSVGLCLFSAPAQECIWWAQGQPGTIPVRRGRTDASAACSTGSLPHVRGESVRYTSLVEAAEVAGVSMDGTVLGVASESGGSLQASRDGSHASGGRAGGSPTADALRSTDVRVEVDPTSVCEVFGRDVTDEKKLLYCQRSEGDRRSHGA